MSVKFYEKARICVKIVSKSYEARSVKIKILFVSAICLLAVPVSKAQIEPYKMPPEVLPVLKENYSSANSDEIFSVGKVTGNIGKNEKFDNSILRLQKLI